MQIFSKKAKALILALGIGAMVVPAINAQSRDIVKGTVVDNFGDPLIGVSVGIRSGGAGTVTDGNGEYSVTITNDTTALIFSYVGFKTVVEKIGSRRVISVTLSEGSEDLDEVMVVAFAKQKKESVISAITTIAPKELKVPSSNLTTALAGRVAGIISYQRSGEPGMDNADFFVRGVTTFGYKKDPLILIDNVEVTTTELARLQVDDIEAFSIMKDATSTALYGARGANGVILVTTKQGTEGKAKISLRVENSISMATQDVELADPITYMRLHNEAVLTRNPLGRILYSDQKINNTISGINPIVFPATDWKEELLSDYTMNQRANLSVSGGGKIARYYVSGSFSNDNGLLKVPKENNFNNNISLKSYSLRANVNMDLTPTTQMAVRLAGTFDDYTGPINGGTKVYQDIMRTNPVLFPAYYPVDDEHIYTNHILFGNYDENGYYLNPYADMVRGYKNYSKSNMSAQLELKQNLDFITKGLFLRGVMNTSRYAYFDVIRAYNPFYYNAGTWDKETNTYHLTILNEEGANQGREELGYSPGAKDMTSELYLEGSLNYNRTFAEKHGVSGLLVLMLRDKLTGNPSGLQASLPYRNIGLSGRFTYSYDSRYFTEFNFGYNGSERFADAHRFGFFPSVGAGYIISNEAFWGDGLTQIIPKLKLKATYGLVGNDALGDARFLYLSEVNLNDGNHSAQFGSTWGTVKSRNGVSLSRYANPDITWEIAYKTNLGLEMNLLNSFDIQFDVYKEHRTNIFMTRTATPATMGLSAQPQANIGEASGQGMDISIDYNKVFNKDLWVQGRANFTYAKSKYLVYEEPTYDNEPWKSHVGYPINQQWGYIAERLFVDDEEAANSPRQNFGEYGGGDIKYKDINGDGQITTLDQVPIGYPDVPEIVYGFGFSVGYKQFDLSAFFQGLARESFWISREATAPYMRYTYNDSEANSSTIYQNALLKAYADDHWSEENRNLYALWPRLSVSEVGNSNNAPRSTWFMRDGAFLRLKSVELGYNFKNLLGTRTRLYMTATNLLTFSKFDLWDPEMGGNGLGYPIQKVFNIGLTMSF
ncbi:MAG: TonB-dependent receptor [Prevotella sp.]|jgi:TonB-linked SusC/RagA family outer membrane protein|nr:TonB-dependent receptor [Prevotella sp.]